MVDIDPERPSGPGQSLGRLELLDPRE